MSDEISAPLSSVPVSKDVRVIVVRMHEGVPISDWLMTVPQGSSYVAFDGSYAEDVWESVEGRDNFALRGSRR